MDRHLLSTHRARLLGWWSVHVFLLRQFFQTIPLEYDDSARIDGAGVLDIFWYIILPMSVPAGRSRNHVHRRVERFLWNYPGHNLLDWQRHIGGTAATALGIMTASMLLTLPPLVVS